MRKRLLALGLALTLLLALTACGRKQNPAVGEEKETETAAPEQGSETEGPDNEDDITMDVADRDDLDPEESGPEIGSRPADLTEEPETGSRPADTTQKPELKPAQKPEEFPAEVEKPPLSTGTVDLTAFYETLAADEDWPAMMMAEGEVLDAFYPGLSDISTNQCGVYTAMISASVGEIALVEVQNAGDVQKVKDIFQARIDYQVGDGENPGGAWYPESIEGWKTGSRIVSNGNFVMLVATYEKSDDVVAAFNALFA